LRKAPSPFSLCPLQNGSAQSGSLRLLHGRPVLLCRDISGRVRGSAERRCRRRRGVQKDLGVALRGSGREKPRRATHVEAMQNSSGSAFCLPPSRIFLHGCLAGSSGGCRAVAIASASSALCALADRLTACGNGYLLGSARVAPFSNINRWGRRSAAGEHVAREAGGDRVGGEVRATGAGARGIVVVLVTRAMELREEEREAPTRAPDDRRDGRRFAHRVAV